MYQVPFRTGEQFRQLAYSQETTDFLKTVKWVLQPINNEYGYLNFIVKPEFIRAAKNNEIDFTKISLDTENVYQNGEFDYSYITLSYENLEFDVVELRFTSEGKIDFDSL